MQKILVVGSILLLLELLFFPYVSTFEENDKFCIRTEPLLLDDIENPFSLPLGEPNCDILAMTMTAKEKESFINTMCSDHGKKHQDDYSYLQLRNGELVGRASYHSICSSKINPLLAWIPYEMIQHHFARELNPKEHTNYIAKATDVDREKTELCHFRHIDLVTNISSDLFSCIIMIFEDNFYGLDSNINVLVEIKPILYELRNVTYLPWSNVTQSYKTMIGKSDLKNPRKEIKQIYGSIDYAYVEKVELNTSWVYANCSLEKLPLLFEHKSAIVELNNDGIGGITIKEKAYFGRSMDPKSSVKVDIIGQWAQHRQQFTADIYEYFGFGIKRFKQELRHGVATFVLIESTEPVYESPESSLLTNSTLHIEARAGDRFQRLVQQNLTNEIDAIEWSDSSKGKNPYPGFYPWFIIALLILGVTILFSIYGMVRSFSKKDEAEKYKFTGL